AMPRARGRAINREHARRRTRRTGIAAPGGGAADGSMILAARLSRGDLRPNGRYGSNYGRSHKRIGGELPQFGEATAFLEAL
ncbi:MAG: hypothetical protein WBE80_12380, partial [Methylocella sp.]